MCLMAMGIVVTWTPQAAIAQDKPSATLDPYEVRLFDETNFSGRMRSLKLGVGKAYAYFEQLGDEQAEKVRSLQVGASIGVVLFRRPFFASQDKSCAATLGSDERPDLIWTGVTAEFLPAPPENASGKTRLRAGVNEQADAGEGGYASVILYRREFGPPPGALLMKRRRSYGRGCGNILRSLNFDRRFVPLNFQTGLANKASASAQPRGCVNLKSDDAAGLLGMLRSDRIALMQPSDLDARYAPRDQRFRVVLFDGDDCLGDSVTLNANAKQKEAVAPSRLDRRDILLSSLLFRDRARSLRVDLPGAARKIIARAAPAAAPTAAAGSESLAKSNVQAAPEALPKTTHSAKVEPATKVGKLAAGQKAAPVVKPAAPPKTVSAQLSEPKLVTPKVTAPAVAKPKTSAPELAPASAGSKLTAAEPKAVPQTAAVVAAPEKKAVLPTARLDPMKDLSGTPQVAAAPTTGNITAQPAAPIASASNQALRTESPSSPAKTQLSQPKPANPEPVRTQSTPTQSTLTQSSQAQAASQPATPGTAAPSDAGNEVFTFPVYDVYRLNFCMNSKGECGEPVAAKWCKMKGYERAVAWQKDNNIGGLFPTFLIGEERICAQYKCDGFTEITCGR